MAVIRFRKNSVIVLIGFFMTFYIIISGYLNLQILKNFEINSHEKKQFFSLENEIPVHLNVCTAERTKFVFIKCMKCATETMATILRRFGYVRNLNFALPIKRNLYFGWPFPIEKDDARPSKFEKDILMEHSIYNWTVMRDLMPKDAVFISIIRSPWNQFKSTYNYFDIGRIATVPDRNITEYISNIEYYDQIYTSAENNRARWCVPNGFSMTQNLMSHCLGMPLGFPKEREDIRNDSEAIQSYLKHLDDSFNVVMIADYFRESLVLLKRRMCWGFKDIIYHHVNVGNYDYKNLKPEGHIYEIHRNWSRVDYLLFDHFNTSFWKKVADEGADFRDEVEHFHLIQMVVERFCFHENKWNSPNEYIGIPSSKFGAGFNVSGQDCSLMNTYMLPMLWMKYFEREGVVPENLGELKDRPKPPKGCSI